MEAQYQVQPFEKKYQQGVVDLILPIQQLEFKVPITIQDQPDLLAIPTNYQQGAGNFWVALHANKVVGTIALIDMGNGQAAMRKMFVEAQHRGKQIGVAQMLFNSLLQWCEERKIDYIFLGTLKTMHAAHRFYTRNGFAEMEKSELPAAFPIMQVDNKFFKLIRTIK